VAEWLVRLAHADDIDALVALDSFAAPTNGRAAEITRWVRESQCFCAEREGTIAAYYAIDDHFFGRPMLELVMVAPAFRRHGLGRKMVEHAIAQTGSELWTSTNQSNRAMQALLERIGFQRSGIVEGLDDGDPELIYRHVTSDKT